ncbi:MAG: DsbA family protein [Gammaproteobacteria bacterium]|jgi:predicted DsbA family dithiol-disulfide isomerase|nr:disulfide bond formation protein DsbA [Chromatiales bacterium]MDP6673611.1 DsbA family protein [Gammaproteobacteria bacterium]
MASIRITHFSDILCVWAYISQIRIAELESTFSQDVVFDFQFFNVFGDVYAKMDRQWGGRGGLAAYGQHVQEVAAGFDHVNLCADVWSRNVPTSSLPAHLFIAAAKLLDSEQGSVVAPLFAASIRKAFFESAVNVSCRDELVALAEGQGIKAADLDSKLDSGQAHALTAQDYKNATELDIRSSPTMVLNEGRQTLSGNVGYRVLEANIRELIRHPVGQHSWC